jgi:hypothetical protein
MHRQVAIVANAFQVTAFLIGIPSLIASLWLGWQILTLPRLTPESAASSTGESTTSLVSLLMDGARLLGKVFGAFASAAQVVITIAAVVSFAALLCSVLLYFVGRGLHSHESWARVVGIVMMLGMLFISGIGALSVRRGLIGLILTAAAAACVYALWTLFRRFEQLP